MVEFRKLLCLALAASAASPALGQAAAQPEPIARATFITTMDGEFRRMDADKNNTLTRKEIEDFQRAVSVLAAQRRNQALFAALDKDRNGSLTAVEFGGLPMNLPSFSADPVLAQTDGNRDGKVTLIEFRSGKVVNFDRMDADKDGVVTPAEMRAAGLIK